MKQVLERKENHHDYRNENAGRIRQAAHRQNPRRVHYGGHLGAPGQDDGYDAASLAELRMAASLAHDKVLELFYSGA